MKHTEMISRRSFLQAAALTAACSASFSARAMNSLSSTPHPPIFL